MTHNAKMVIGLALMFIIGGISALRGQFGWLSDLSTTLIPLLLYIEHLMNGNTAVS